MRFFFILILLAGVILGVAYPRYAGGPAETEIGTWSVFDQDAGFQIVDIELDPDDAPISVLVDLTVAERFDPSEQKTVLTITASSGGGTPLAETLTFSDSEPVADSPQTASWTYRGTAGTFDPTGKRHKFVIGPGDAEGIEINSVHLVLVANAAALDERIQPIGYALMALGFVGLVLAFIGSGRRSRSSGEDKPDRRWGRGAG